MADASRCVDGRVTGQKDRESQSLCSGTRWDMLEELDTHSHGTA